MKIPGIASLYATNEKLLSKPHLLRKERVAIDGDSLCQAIFERMCLNLEPSGDFKNHYRNDIYCTNLVLYRNEVREFFINLIDSGVKPVVLFGGQSVTRSESYFNAEDLKHWCAITKRPIIWNHSRFDLQNRKLIADDPQSYHEEKLILAKPPTLERIFREIVCRELVIPHKALYYSDTEINSYLMSDPMPIITDSDDVLSYPLPRGFILPQSVRYKDMILEPRFAVKCSFYDTTKTTKILPSMFNKHLALVRLICHPPGELEMRLSNSIMNSTEPKGPSIFDDGLLKANMTGRQQDIKNIYNWVWEKGTNAQKRYLSRLPSKLAEAYKNAIAMPDNIAPIGSGKHRYIDLLNNSLQEKPMVNVNETIHHACYMIDVCRMSRALSQILMHRRVVDEPYLQDFVNHRSHFLIALRPLQYIASLFPVKLLRVPQLVRYYIEQSGNLKVQYFYAHISGYAWEAVNEIDFARLDYDEPNTPDVLRMSEARRIIILQRCFSINKPRFDRLTLLMTAALWPHMATEGRLCFLLIMYLVEVSSVTPSIDLLKAVWLVLFYYGHNKNVIPRPRDRPKGLRKYLKLMKRFEIMPHQGDDSETTPYHNEIAHQITQLHLAYRWFHEVYDLLNVEMNTPQSQMHQVYYTQYAIWFNSTMIFRVMQQLSDERTHPELGTNFFLSCVEAVPTISLFFDQIQALIFPDDPDEQMEN